jgi:hypothetical protein
MKSRKPCSVVVVPSGVNSASHLFSTLHSFLTCAGTKMKEHGHGGIRLGVITSTPSQFTTVQKRECRLINSPGLRLTTTTFLMGDDQLPGMYTSHQQPSNILSLSKDHYLKNSPLRLYHTENVYSLNPYSSISLIPLKEIISSTSRKISHSVGNPSTE